MNAIDRAGFAEGMNNGGRVLLYKLWPLDGSGNHAIWYYAGKNNGHAKGNLAARVRWTNNLSEAVILDHATAWDYAFTLSDIYSDYEIKGGQSCALGVMPHYGPATVEEQ